MRDGTGRLVVGTRGEAASGPGQHDDADVVVVVELASASRSGIMTSNAIEFIRSGRFRVTSATPGCGRSMRTKSDGLIGARYRAPVSEVGCLRGDDGVDVEVPDLLNQLLELGRRQSARLVEHHMTLFLKIIRVGMERISASAASCSFASVVDLGEDDVGMLVRGGGEGGCERPHGPHQELQKSTRTMSLPSTMSLKFCLVRSWVATSVVTRSGVPVFPCAPRR